MTSFTVLRCSNWDIPDVHVASRGVAKSGTSTRKTVTFTIQIHLGWRSIWARALSCRISKDAESPIQFFMHDFTRDNWTIEDTDRKRDRLRRVRDDELLEHLASAVRMCR